MRSVLVCGWFFASVGLAAAQPPDEDDDASFKPPDRPRIGVRVGANFSNLIDNVPGRFDDRTGFLVGVLVLAPLGDRFAIDACLAYSQKGVTSTDNTELLVLDYVELPVVLTASFTLGATSRARVFAGVNSAINVRASLRTAGEDRDLMRTTANVDLGFLAGGGIDLETGGGAIMIDLRLELGLVDIDTTEVDARHRVLSVNGAFAY